MIRELFENIFVIIICPSKSVVGAVGINAGKLEKVTL